MSVAPVLTDPIRDGRHLDILLDSGASPGRAGGLAASLTFGWRALLKVRHEPKQLVDATAIPALFTILFTYVFGGALGGSPEHYLTTLLPGTMVMSVVIVTMYGARLADDVTTGVFDRFRSMAVWRGAPVVGGLLSDAGRYLLAAAIVVVLGVAIGYRPGGGAPGVIAAVVLVVASGSPCRTCGLSLPCSYSIRPR